MVVMMNVKQNKNVIDYTNVNKVFVTAMILLRKNDEWI